MLAAHSERAEELHRLMARWKFNQSSLARTIEVSRGTVKRWLDGTCRVPLVVLLWLRAGAQV